MQDATAVFGKVPEMRSGRRRLLASALQASLGLVPTATGRRFASRHTIVEQVLMENRLYWMKTYLREPADAAREHAFLSQAWKDGLTVVEPFTLLDGAASLVTHHAEGEGLSRLIDRCFAPKASQAAWDEARGACAKSGRWLARLHAWHLADKRPQDVVPLCRQIHSLIRWLPQRTRRRILHLTDAMAARLTSADLQRCRTHGDYAPHNILVSRDDLTVLDPAFPPEVVSLGNFCAPYEDVARFCGFLCGIHTEEVTCPGRAALIDCFLEAYGEGTGTTMDRHTPGLTLWLMKYLLLMMRDWSNLLARIARGRRYAATLDRWLDNLSFAPTTVAGDRLGKTKIYEL